MIRIRDTLKVRNLVKCCFCFSKSRASRKFFCIHDVRHDGCHVVASDRSIHLALHESQQMLVFCYLLCRSVPLRVRTDNFLCRFEFIVKERSGHDGNELGLRQCSAGRKHTRVVRCVACSAGNNAIGICPFDLGVSPVGCGDIREMRLRSGSRSQGWDGKG